MHEPHEHSASSDPPDPATASGTGALFEVLTTGERDPARIYTAIREVENMAGQSVVAQLTALNHATTAELTARLRAGLTEVKTELRRELLAAMAEHKSDLQEAMAEHKVSMERQFGRIWTVLLLILGTLFGAMTTAVTLLLPN